MKLQQKIEKSLDDIIKTNKKTKKQQPSGISKKSKPITKAPQKAQKLQRLRQLNKRTRSPANTQQVSARKPVRSATPKWAAGGGRRQSQPQKPQKPQKPLKRNASMPAPRRAPAPRKFAPPKRAPVQTPRSRPRRGRF